MILSAAANSVRMGTIAEWRLTGESVVTGVRAELEEFVLLERG